MSTLPTALMPLMAGLSCGFAGILCLLVPQRLDDGAESEAPVRPKRILHGVCLALGTLLLAIGTGLLAFAFMLFAGPRLRWF